MNSKTPLPLRVRGRKLPKMSLGIGKSIILVVDGLGVGEQPDAYLYGKRGANTLSHISELRPKMEIPNLARMGLTNLTYTKGWPRDEEPIGFFRESDAA